MRTLSARYRLTDWDDSRRWARLNNGSEEKHLRSLGWVNVYGTEWCKQGIVASTPEMALNVEGWMMRK